LSQAGQGVVLGENADDRPTRADGGRERGGNLGDAALDLEPGVFQCIGQQLRRPHFLISRLGPLPDLLGDGPGLLGTTIHRGGQIGLRLCRRNGSQGRE
jgi:hypothetical protein